MKACPNAEIGRRLFIAESTVKAHTHHVYDKLGVHSRKALMLNAAQRGYATPSDATADTASDVRRRRYLVRNTESGASGVAVVLPSISQQRDESHDRVGVELAPHCLEETVSSGWIHHGRAIRSVRGHRVVCIRHGDDSRDRRDLGSEDPVGVTVAVDALVVMTNDQRNVGVCINLGQDPLPNLGVAPPSDGVHQA